MLVQYDFDGNGIRQAALVNFEGKKGGLVSLGDLDGDTRGGVVLWNPKTDESESIGGLRIEGIGSLNLRDCFFEQGVAEAFDLSMVKPIAISASGTEMVGGLAGVQTSWLVDMDPVHVCRDGRSIQTGFPNGLRAKIADGAEFGRCEFLEN
jgi:hypothetical protein